RVFGSLGLVIGALIAYALLRIGVAHFFPDATRPDQELGTAVDGTTQTPAIGAASPADYGDVIIRNARIAIGILCLFILPRIWSVDIFAGSQVVAAGFQVVTTLILARCVWGIIKVAINRHLPRENVDPAAQLDDEAAHQGSRIETLLPLIRNFLFVSIIVIALLSIVAAMGVNIGPLIAGAGVVGIAVGFGAQTLVRDILSGVFFLMEDAFRVGEYIDV